MRPPRRLAQKPSLPARRPARSSRLWPCGRANMSAREPVSLTATGARIGTPGYMAPEQLAGGEAGPAADQFSFCVALYEALYHQRPFEGGSITDQHQAVVRGQVRPPPRATAVPARIHSALLRGLRPDPDDRYPSMGELLTVLSRDPGRARRRMAVAIAFAAACGRSWRGCVLARRPRVTGHRSMPGRSRQSGGALAGPAPVAHFAAIRRPE